MQRKAEFLRLGLEDALQTSISCSKGLRAYMLQRELEFKNVERFCMKSIESTAALHVAADHKAASLQKLLTASQKKVKMYKGQDVQGSQEVSQRGGQDPICDHQ